MAHAERKDKTLERNPAPLLDGGKQITYRGLAIALDVLQPDLDVARGQREDIGWFLHPSVFKKEFDLLLAATFDIERAAGGEPGLLLDLLVAAREPAAA